MQIQKFSLTPNRGFNPSPVTPRGQDAGDPPGDTFVSSGLPLGSKIQGGGLGMVRGALTGAGTGILLGGTMGGMIAAGCLLLAGATHATPEMSGVFLDGAKTALLSLTGVGVLVGGGLAAADGAREGWATGEVPKHLWSERILRNLTGLK